MLHGSRDETVGNTRENTSREDLTSVEGRTALPARAVGHIPGGKFAFCVFQRAKLDGYAYPNPKQRCEGSLDTDTAPGRVR